MQPQPVNRLGELHIVRAKNVRLIWDFLILLNNLFYYSAGFLRKPAEYFNIIFTILI